MQPSCYLLRCCSCSAYGAAGREQYTRFELLDLAICIISYATALSTGISMLARALPPGWPKQQLQLANLLPWAAAAADVVENVLILAMLVSYPKLVVMLAPCAVAATCTKWVLLMAAIAAFGVTSLLAILAGCRQGSALAPSSLHADAAGAKACKAVAASTVRCGCCCRP